jgi:hypothetical protein
VDERISGHLLLLKQIYLSKYMTSGRPAQSCQSRIGSLRRLQITALLGIGSGPHNIRSCPVNYQIDICHKSIAHPTFFLMTV